MSAHTPGPWKVYGPRENHADIQVEHTEVTGPNPVVDTYSQGVCDIDGFVCRNRPDEALANARLIAAAPELLEALEYVIGAHSIVHAQGWIERAKALMQARAAIAKAKGDK